MTHPTRCSYPCNQTYKPSHRFTDEELSIFAKELGPQIVAFCQKNLGKQVGDGDCWSLCNHALDVSQWVTEWAVKPSTNAI